MLGIVGKGLGATTRFAGDIMKRGLQSAPGKSVGVGDVVSRLGMDAMFGTMTAMNTPGSMTDKMIAGGLTTVGGGLGGAVMSGMLPGNLRHSAPALRQMTELAGGIGGDMFGMNASDAILRAKSPDGMSERDRQMKQADDMYREQIEQDILRKYGMGGLN